MKYSRQRELILKTLRENAVHPTAEQLYQFIRSEEPTISLATVYRNLNTLAQKGIIKKIEGLENMAHFDHQTHEHYHFICTKCHQVFDIPCDVAPNLVSTVEEETGMSVSYCDISFRGICNHCKNRN